MPARRVSEADRAVIEECARRGAPEINARKLERWRRYLPDRVVEHRAGLRGSRTTNPPGYVDNVLARNALIQAGMTLREAPMGLFARGFSVRIEELRKVYADLYAPLRHGLTPDSAPVGFDAAEPADRADTLARIHAAAMRHGPAGRRWARRAKRLVALGGPYQGDDPNRLFASALSAMFTWMAGERPSPEGITEALSIAGLNDGQEPEDAGIHLAATNLGAVSAAIETATEADWSDARHDIAVLAEYSELRIAVEQLLNPDNPLVEGLADAGLHDIDVRAVLIPIALVFSETTRQNLLDQRDQFAVALRVLNDMPVKFRPFLHEDRASQLTKQSAEFQTELNTFLVSWAATHPGDAAKFTGGVSGSASGR